jgi:phosphoglycolate phosphatase
VIDLSRVRGIVFDLDGTLVDGFDGIATAVNAARAAAGLSALSRGEVTSRVGRGLDDLLASTLPATEVARGAAVFRAAYDTVCERESRPMPGAAEVLPDLSARGYRLAVASNKLASYSTRILRALGLAPALAAIHGPDTAGKPKPDPAMIDACLAAMGVERERAVYVGDMPLDVEAAVRAGVGIVLLAGGASPRAALERTGERVLAGLGELATSLPQRPD